MAKVSIVTPCYNAEKYIGKAIESVSDAQMQAGTDMMQRGQLSAGVRLYLDSAKKYFMSFLPFSL